METLADLLPVRRIGDGPWEVLLAEKNQWLQFQSERDAHIFAKAKILECKAMQDGIDSESLAAEFEELSKVMRNSSFAFGSRFFEQSAADMRERLATAD